MQKQLNPDLFGTSLPLNKSHNPQSSSQNVVGHERGASLDHILNLDQKVADLRLQLSELKSTLTDFIAHSKMTQTSYQKQFENFANAIKALQSNDVTLQESMQKTLSHQHHKSSEIQAIESKMKEQLDRHQMVLRSYDLKLNQLQEHLNNKEEILIAYQTQLQRLKRA